jgi:formylglycine-generating enzyme
MPDLAAVPGGTVALHDARTGTARTVELKSFELARVPLADDGIPVLGLSWLDAVARCNAASTADGLTPAYVQDAGVVRWDVTANGFRLPTEAEWVHACRAGTTGAAYGLLDEIAWYDQQDGPHPVGLKSPNAFGLHDLLGNVWEWCWDYLDPARYRDYRLLKGGAWANTAEHVRVGVRRGGAPEAAVEDAGLRFARGAGSTPGSFQGWSEAADQARADLSGPLPVGWTPLGR